jgi:hypothetical protein
MLLKIHGTNFLGPTNIKCQNEPVLPPAQVFYFNSQALHIRNQRIFLCHMMYITQYHPRCRLN